MSGKSSPPQTWAGLALALPGGQVLLSRVAAARLLVALARFESLAAARDGGAGLARELREVVEVLRTATRPAVPDASPSGSGSGHAAADITAGDGFSTRPASGAHDPITTQEAGRRLGITDRHVRRLVTGPGSVVEATRVGRAYALTDDQVAALAAHLDTQRRRHA